MSMLSGLADKEEPQDRHARTQGSPLRRELLAESRQDQRLELWLLAPADQAWMVKKASSFHINPGFRGRYWAQLPKSREDISNIGNLIRMPCSNAVVRAASLAPG